MLIRWLGGVVVRASDSLRVRLRTPTAGLVLGRVTICGQWTGKQS